MDESSSKKTSLVCTICNQSSFTSRNQLFKHVKTCSVPNLNPSSSNLSDNSSSSSMALSIPLSPSYIHEKALERIKESILGIHDIQVYILGGRLHGRTLQSVEYFSFTSFTWELCSPMIENRGSHGAIALNGIVYAIGGGGLRSNLSTCEEYHVTKKSWNLMSSSMSTYRHALSIVSDQRRFIYALGGWEEGSHCSRFIERYDTVDKNWSKLATMLTPRRLMGAVLLDHKIYTFGGISDSSSDKTIASSTTITSTSKESSNREKQKPVSSDDKIALESESWFSRVVEVYDILTDTWSRCIHTLPYADATSATTIQDRNGNEIIFIFIHGKGCYQYNPILDNYESKGPLPLKDWYNFDVTTFKDFIFLHGGVSHGDWLKVMYMYDTVLEVWVELPSMLRQRRRCAAAILTL